MADLIVRPLAEADIIAAHTWYSQQRESLGAEFVAELGQTLERVKANPRQFPEAGQSVRRALVQRFPYSVYFVKHDGAAIVIAVLHLRRREAAWRDRASTL